MRVPIPENLIPVLRELQNSQTETLEGYDAVVLTLGLSDAWYLILDGRVMVLEYFSKEETTPRESQSKKETTSAIVVGAKVRKCPELLSLLPARPNDALKCLKCHGSGWWTPNETLRIICDACGGLGCVEGKVANGDEH